MTASIDHLHATRPDVVADDAVARVAPVAHAHVNSLGRYDLNRQPPPVASSDRYARPSMPPTLRSRHHRWASVATNTKRWISRR